MVRYTYNWKTRRETFNFWDLVQLILEVWQYVSNDTFDWDKYNHEACACWTHHEPLGLLSLVFVGIVPVIVAKSLKMKSKHQILKIAYWNRKWICWEIIIMFGIMPPNAVTSLPADTIVHWRNGSPSIGDVLSGTLNGWVRMMDNIALGLRRDKNRVHPNFWASPRQIF